MHPTPTRDDRQLTRAGCAEGGDGPDRLAWCNANEVVSSRSRAEGLARARRRLPLWTPHVATLVAFTAPESYPGSEIVASFARRRTALIRHCAAETQPAKRLIQRLPRASPAHRGEVAESFMIAATSTGTPTLEPAARDVARTGEREHYAVEPTMSAVDLAPSRGQELAPRRAATTHRADEQTAPVTVPGAAPLDDPIRSLSIVIPVYNEEGNLEELHRRLSAALAEIGLDYEILLIDDGSRDQTWRIIRTLAAADPRVAGIRHRRNFGKARALAAGFDEARGDAVITMDGDLQDDPDELPRFLAMLGEGYDVISGWKQKRQDPLGKTFPSKLFNWTVSRVSGVPLHDFNCGFKAYRVVVVQNLRLYGELHRFTPVLAHAEGFRIGELPVRHHARRWGQSKYGWSRLVKGFLDLLTVKFLTEYGQRPMHVLGLPGIVAMGLGVIIGLFLLLDRVVSGAAIGTRPLLSLAVLLVVIGAQFFGLGLLGEMLAHNFQPRRQVPSDIAPAAIRETINLRERAPRAA